MAKLGLKTFSMAIDKGWERIPDAAFRGDTYIPKDLQKHKDKLSDDKNNKDSKHRGSSRDRERRNRRRNRRSNSLPGDNDDDYRSERRRPSEQYPQQRSQHDSYDPYRKPPYDQNRNPDYYHNTPPPGYQQGPQPGYHEQSYPSYGIAGAAGAVGGAAVGYQPPSQSPSQFSPQAQSQPQPQAYNQGDPNFPYNSTAPPQPINSQDRDLGQEETDNPTSPVDNNNNENTRGLQGSVDSPQMSNDQYYAQQQPARDPSGYHRYNPSDYQPQGHGGSNQAYNGSAYQDDRHGPPSRYSRDPYQRPASAGAYDDRGRNDNDSYAQDDRRGRDKHKSSRRDKSRSGSGSNVRDLMHIDKSEKGLAAGGIGALAGGYIGHRIGKGPLATVAGVILGGLGANVWEGREERMKEEKRHGDHAHSSHSSRRTHSEGRGRDRGDRDRRASGYDDDDGNRQYNDQRDPRDRQSYSGRGRGGEYDDDEGDDSEGSYGDNARPSSRRR